MEAFRARWREALGQPQSTVVNPYPGLRSFDVNEAHIFRARFNQTKALREAFAGVSARGEPRHVIMVVGGSSSGKSSIVKAGLLAGIHSLQMPDSSGNWYVAECRPGQSPMQELLSGLATMVVGAIFSEVCDGDAQRAEQDPELAEEVEQALDAVGGGKAASTADRGDIRAAALRRVRALLDERLWSARHQLQTAAVAPALTLFVREALNRLDHHLHPLRAGRPRLLVSIDQFEEIFRCPDNAERRAVFDLLRFVDQAKQQQAPELYLVASMRSEELHRCSEEKGISDIVNRSIHLVELMSREDAEKAIVEPGRLTLQGYFNSPMGADNSWPYEKAAVEAIANSYSSFATGKAEHRADALPLLQHFLRLVWHSSVGEWVGNTAGNSNLLIDGRSLSAIPGWNEPGPTQVSRDTPPSEGEPQNSLARVLNSRADAVFKSAIKAWCNAVGDSSEESKTLARMVLKAAFVSLVRQDDRRRVVRDWQTVEEMLSTSGEVERLAPVNGEGTEAERTARFKKPLEDALREFEKATLIERRADPESRPGRERPDKYSVYHESFIRNWKRYADWVREAGRASAILRSIYVELNDPSEDPTAEDMITVGGEADLNVVIGSAGDEIVLPLSGAGPAVAATAEATPGAAGRGWASQNWILTEISRIEIPGARFSGQDFLVRLREARQEAIAAHQTKVELEARAAAAEASTALAKVRVYRLRAIFTGFITFSITAVSALILSTYFYRSSSIENDFRYSMLRLWQIGSSVTEAGRETNRHLYEDRDLWLAINALEPNDDDWENASNRIQNERDGLRNAIINKSRNVLADLNFAPAEEKFFAQAKPLFGDVTTMEVKCLRTVGDKASFGAPNSTASGGSGPVPSSVEFRFGTIRAPGSGNDTGRGAVEALEYSTDGGRSFQRTNATMLGLGAATICVSQDASALLLLSKGGWPTVILNTWTRATLPDGKIQWFLQVKAIREVRSWSSSALFARYAIDTTKDDNLSFFTSDGLVGFEITGTFDKQDSQSVLWTNDGFSAPSFYRYASTAHKPGVKTECRGVSRSRSDCVMSYDGAAMNFARYNVFNGKEKYCTKESTYCDVRFSVQNGGTNIIELTYTGRPPVEFDINDDYLWFRGDDDVVQAYDRRADTAKKLLALRWLYLDCDLGEDVPGDKSSSLGALIGDTIGVKDMPDFYREPGLPQYFDGANCGQKASGG